LKVFKISVKISLKPELFDPEGKTIERAINRLGIYVNHTRVSKVVEFEIEAEDREEALERVQTIASKLLSNPVLHKYTIEITEK